MSRCIPPYIGIRAGAEESPCCLAVQVLRGPQKLPTPQAAAYKSMPEAQMVGRRIALAEVSSRSRCLTYNASLLM